MTKQDLLDLITKKDEQLRNNQERISELEMLLDEYEENDVSFLLSDTEKSMLKIIGEQIEKLGEISKVSKMDKDEAKLFDTYVKDIVAIRGKMPTPKTSNDAQTEEDLADKLSVLYEA